VQDSDRDGLVDIWETSPTTLSDPNGQALPNLAAMGANPFQKDLFVEIGYMKSDAPATYGDVSKPKHSHLPTPAALKLVGDAFANAPTPIRVHFDVGNAYPSSDADQYIIRGAGLARGGDAIDEMVTVCAPGATDQPWVCQFSNYQGTVGWKSGFRFLRDEVLVAPEGQDCDAPGSACELRFDRNRKDMFRYALFAHAIGLPKAEEPCLDANDVAVPPNAATGRCDAPLRSNPDFHVPRTNTGIGDFPGGDVMVTLGGFADHDGLPVGTPFMQASTLMHELGHNLERRHGGEAFEPNCKPTYLSVMNYLYQLRGLLDDVGRPHLDFSGSSYAGSLIDETSLADGLLGGLPYRIGWYAPLTGSFLQGQGTPARRHCDGSELLSTDVSMVRIDARTAAGAIDWNANGSLADSAFTLDVNFNGRLDGSPNPALGGSDDWSNILLNQIGARRNTGGVYVVDSAGHLLVGPLSLDSGRGDLGRGDLGRGDLGRGDLGRGDLGRGDLGRGDLGRGDLGRGDLGRGDLGRGDLGRGDLGGGDLFVGNPYQEGELDAETAGDLARTPPNTFAACVIGVDYACSGTPLHGVSLSWSAPNVGGVLQYFVYRVAGETLVPDTPSTPWTGVGQVSAAPGQIAYSLVDGASLTDAARYTYFAVAAYADGITSDPSNLVTITAVNEPPAAGDDGFSTGEDTPLIQAAPGVLANDADPDTSSTLAAVLVAGPSHGTVSLNADGSFTYTPAADYYGADAFTYRATATYGAGEPTVDSNIATVTISVIAVNDAPLATGDAYTTAEDTPLTVAAPGVLANDADIDGPALTAVVATEPAHGTLILNLNGTFTYAPAANYFGPDAFTYRVFDGTIYSDPATVALSVTAVNDPPTAANDGYSMLQGATLTVAAPGVLGNDSDSDSTLTAAVATGPSNGTLALASNGSFTYTPTGTFFGTDSFTYIVTDGAASSNATVTITVNKLVYGFANVQNLPPPSTKTFKPGSAVPLAWRFTVNGIAYNSVSARPSVTIRRADNSVVYTGSPTDPGASSFQPPTASNGYTWQFNWQTKGLVAGSYYVYVTSEQTGQTFPIPPSLGYLVKLK
jgi:VCBS repeat-containing protein